MASGRWKVIRQRFGIAAPRVEVQTQIPWYWRWAAMAVFLGIAADDTRAAALDGVASFEWLDPMVVDPDDLAFPSMRDGLRRYRAERSR